MAQLINVSNGDVQCSECDVCFQLDWQRNAWTERVEFCPFCGNDIEEEPTDV